MVLGYIHNLFASYVCSEHGDETYRRILVEAGLANTGLQGEPLAVPSFETTCPYADGLMYK